MLGLPRRKRPSAGPVDADDGLRYGGEGLVVGARGVVVGPEEGLEVVVDGGGWLVDCWGSPVVVGGSSVEGVDLAVVLVVGAVVGGTAVAAGVAGTNTGLGTGAGRTSR